MSIHFRTIQTPPAGTKKITAKKDLKKGNSISFACTDTSEIAQESLIDAPQGLFATSTIDALFLNLKYMSENKDQLIEHGQHLLEGLEKLHLHFLGGTTIQVSHLHDLQQLLQTEKATNDDPKLQELIEEIEIRTAVELAKLEPR